MIPTTSRTQPGKFFIDRSIRYTYDIVTNGKKMFEVFKKHFPSTTVTYDQYREAIEQINVFYRDHILDSGNVVMLPFGLGKIMVQKNKRKLKQNAEGKTYLQAPVNWGESAKQGKIIYHLNEHTQAYTYRYMWFANSSYIEPVNIWKMIMTRETQHALRDKIRSGSVDIYRECLSRRTNNKILEQMKKLG